MTSLSTPTDRLLVATGNSGKIFRLAGDPYPADPDCARERAAGHRPAARSRKGACSSQHRIPGKLLRLAAARADRGTYTSDVRDAQTVALWGTHQVAVADTGGQPSRNLYSLREHEYAR